MRIYNRLIHTFDCMCHILSHCRKRDCRLRSELGTINSSFITISFWHVGCLCSVTAIRSLGNMTKAERRKDGRRMFGRKNQNKEHKKIWKDRYERNIFPDPHGPFCKYFKNKLFHMSDYPMAYVAVIFTLFLLYVVIRYSLGWYYLTIASVSFAFSIWIFVSLWRM